MEERAEKFAQEERDAYIAALRARIEKEAARAAAIYRHHMDRGR